MLRIMCYLVFLSELLLILSYNVFKVFIYWGGGGLFWGFRIIIRKLYFGVLSVMESKNVYMVNKCFY